MNNEARQQADYGLTDGESVTRDVPIQTPDDRPALVDLFWPLAKKALVRIYRSEYLLSAVFVIAALLLVIWAPWQ